MRGRRQPLQWFPPHPPLSPLFITAHMCLSFEAPTAQLWKSSHLGGSTSGTPNKFEQPSLPGSDIRAGFLIYPALCGLCFDKETLSCCFAPNADCCPLAFLFPAFPFPAFPFSPPASVCAIWMSSHVISMPLALIIDSSCGWPLPPQPPACGH